MESTYFGEYLSGSLRLQSWVVHTNTPELWRAEMPAYQTHNDASLNGYNGLTLFSSMVNENVSIFFEKFGLIGRPDENRYGYTEGTPVANLFMNLKYLIARDGFYSNHYDLEEIYENSGEKLLLNTHYLPMGFMVSTDLLEWSKDNTIVDFVVFYVMDCWVIRDSPILMFLGCRIVAGPYLSNTVSYMIVNTHSFCWNRLWTFQKRGRVTGKEVLRYVITSAGYLLISSAGLAASIHILSLPSLSGIVPEEWINPLAKLPTFCITILYNYLMNKFWVFRT